MASQRGDDGKSERDRSRERSNKPKKRDIPGNSSTNANLVPLGSKSRSSRGDDGKSERDSWYADPEARSVEDRQKCESFEWNDVKGSALADEDERERKKREALKKEKEALRREKEAIRASSSRRSRDRDRASSSRHFEDDRHSSSRQREKEDYRSSSKHQDEYRDDYHSRSTRSSHRDTDRSSRSHHREEEVGGSYWETHRVKLEEEEEDTRRRIKDEERGRSKKDKKEKRKEKRDKRHSKRSSREEGEYEEYEDYQGDHEEVNEGGFEVDSVGKVENSEETLQKMKSAIIGILDEEIFTLAKKIKD